MKSEITSKIKTVQGQYYSNMDFDHETVGWTSVDWQKNHGTKLAARKAIDKHCKKYGVTPQTREFRILTTVVTKMIEQVGQEEKETGR